MAWCAAVWGCRSGVEGGLRAACAHGRAHACVRVACVRARQYVHAHVRACVCACKHASTMMRGGTPLPTRKRASELRPCARAAAAHLLARANSSYCFHPTCCSADTISMLDENTSMLFPLATLPTPALTQTHSHTHCILPCLRTAPLRTHTICSPSTPFTWRCAPPAPPPGPARTASARCSARARQS